MTKLFLSLIACFALTGFSTTVNAAPGQLYAGGLSDGKIYKFDGSGNRTVFVSIGGGWLAFSSNGNLFATDTGNGGIVKITPAGAVSTFDANAGIVMGDIAFDRFGDLFAIDQDANSASTIYKYTPAGTRTVFKNSLDNPRGLAFDNNGNLFVSLKSNGTNGAGSIIKISPSGTVTPFVAGLFDPEGLAFDASGNLYEADLGSGNIFKFTPLGVKTTFKGGLSQPRSLVFDRAGNLFVGEFGSNQITQIDASGTIIPPDPFANSVVGGLAIQPPARDDFNRDGLADYLLFDSTTRRSAIWYLGGGPNNTTLLGGVYGPTAPAGWTVVCVADINLDGELDYVLYKGTTRQTAIWYLNNGTFVSSVFGPTVTAGWRVIAAVDMDHDGHPDYVLYQPTIRKTAVWYLNGPTFVSSAYGPTLPAGWALADVNEFNNDGEMDLVLATTTGRTAIWYLNGTNYIGGALGPTLPAGWTFQGSADFNRDGMPDFALYQASTRRTAVWYLNGPSYVSGAFGPTLASGYSLVSP